MRDGTIITEWDDEEEEWLPVISDDPDIAFSEALELSNSVAEEMKKLAAEKMKK